MMTDWSALANHLWQSTLFALAVLALASVFQRAGAHVRYWLWLSASVKFLFPFSLLVSLGRLFEVPHASLPPVPRTVSQIGQAFAVVPDFEPSTTVATPVYPELIAAIIWFAGFAAIATLWFAGWWRIRGAVRRARTLPIAAPVQVKSSTAMLEPGVFGIFKPVLLLPEGIADRLSAAQLDAILAHEFCHVRRRDNLAAGLHKAVEAIFWFHPLVWWIGARLVEERERACDEEVLRLGNGSRDYAEGILSVCRFYLEFPVACGSGVTGSHLKRRIENIMANRASMQLTSARKLLLASAGFAAVLGPIAAGIFHAPRLKAQSESLKFEVASVRPADPDGRRVGAQFMPGGGLRVQGAPLKFLVMMAYNVQPHQISGGESWVDSERYDVLANAPESEAGQPSDSAQRDRSRRRLQALLAERFQLALQQDTREAQGYALTVAKGGSKLQPSAKSQGINQSSRGELIAEGAGISLLVRSLSAMLREPIVDRTGLDGVYEFALRWTPGASEETAKLGLPVPPSQPDDGAGPSLFTALQEQLGLKLQREKVADLNLVIVRADRPTEN